MRNKTKTIGSRAIYFTGSDEFHKRTVRKDEYGRYWCTWYGQQIRVYNKFGNDYKSECCSAGWRTVLDY